MATIATPTFVPSSAVKEASATATEIAPPPASPSEENLSKKLVDEMQAIFGKHPGYRTTHAKGKLLDGTFTPSEQAKNLTVAPHFHNAHTKVIARFSVGGGIPHIPDTHDSANPIGIALRFHVDEHKHTDMICHSFQGFPVRNGEDFYQFLHLARTAKADPTNIEAQKAFGAFLVAHPKARTFVTATKPCPHSYGTITFYGVNTHVLTNAKGEVTNIRYRIIPEEGDHLYTPEEVKAKLQSSPNYLNDDLAARLPSKPIVLKLEAQIADKDDVLDDATINYKSTTFVPVGTITLKDISKDNDAKQKEIMFSPVPKGVEGIAPSKDPLIQDRHGVYYISGSQRRADKQVE